MIVTAALLCARQASAASAEQTINISFTGVYQGPTNTSGGIETTSAKTIGLANSQIIRAIAYDLGDTSFRTWNGASIRLSTDFATGAKSIILRKGASTVDVSKFFTNAPGLDLLSFEARLDYIKVAHRNNAPTNYYQFIRLTGKETLKFSSTTLSFTLKGYGNGLVNLVTKVLPTTPKTTNTLPIVILHVPSIDTDPGPAAIGAFEYSPASGSTVSGPVHNGVLTLGNPDTSH